MLCGGGRGGGVSLFDKGSLCCYSLACLCVFAGCEGLCVEDVLCVEERDTERGACVRENGASIRHA